MEALAPRPGPPGILGWLPQGWRAPWSSLGARVDGPGQVGQWRRWEGPPWIGGPFAQTSPGCGGPHRACAQCSRLHRLSGDGAQVSTGQGLPDQRQQKGRCEQPITGPRRPGGRRAQGRGPVGCCPSVLCPASCTVPVPWLENRDPPWPQSWWGPGPEVASGRTYRRCCRNAEGWQGWGALAWLGVAWRSPS